MTDQEISSDDSFYDDAGRWWPNNAEWCDRCQGMGTEDCDCGGDFCFCGAGDNLTCRRCDGEGYWIPTPADIAAREQMAKWWRELNAQPAQGIEAGTDETPQAAQPAGQEPGPQDAPVSSRLSDTEGR